MKHFCDAQVKDLCSSVAQSLCHHTTICFRQAREADIWRWCKCLPSVLWIALILFIADTTMHPVLKNLGITDKVLSFIMGSVNDNKVKTCFRQVINGCEPSDRSWRQIEQTLYLISALTSASICSLLYMPMWAHVQPGDVVETHWGVHDGRMKWPVLIVSDRPWSAVIFPLWLLQSADHSQESESRCAANRGNHVCVAPCWWKNRGQREWLVSANKCVKERCLQVAFVPTLHCRQPAQSLNLGLAYVKWQ